MIDQLMPDLRLLLLGIILLSNTSKAAELTFYTGADNQLNNEAFSRLSVALKKLGHEAKCTIEGTRRTLQLANTIGDGELMRVAELFTLFPKLSNNLIRVDEPLITVEFVEISKTLIPQELVGKGKTAILKDIFILEQQFPTAVKIDGYKKLFELLKADRVEKIILPVSSQKMIQDNPLYSADLNIKTIKTQAFYTYLHKKHQLIAEQLSAVLKTMNSQGFD